MRLLLVALPKFWRSFSILAIGASESEQRIEQVRQSTYQLTSKFPRLVTALRTTVLRSSLGVAGVEIIASSCGLTCDLPGSSLCSSSESSKSPVPRLKLLRRESTSCLEGPLCDSPVMLRSMLLKTGGGEP